MKYLSLLIVILWSSAVHAQCNTYFGVEGGAGKSIFETSYGVRGASIHGDFQPSFTFLFAQDLNESLSLETGVGKAYYNYILRFDGNDAFLGMGSQALNAWQIPLRLTAKYNLLQRKIFFTTTLGYVYCINSDYGSRSGMGGGSFINNGADTDTISIVAEMNPGARKTFGMLQTGAGVKFIVRKRLNIDLGANYYNGFKRVAVYSLRTVVNQKTTNETSGRSNGNYWNVALSLRYPISDLWRKPVTR